MADSPCVVIREVASYSRKILSSSSYKVRVANCTMEPNAFKVGGFACFKGLCFGTILVWAFVWSCFHLARAI